MPTLLRSLLYVATISLLLGMAVLRFENRAVGAALLAFAVVVSLLVLEIIDDLDDRMRGLPAMLLDRRIEDAMREGKFDNLPGAGQPLDLEPMPAEENLLPFCPLGMSVLFTMRVQ